jgi:hypothetical protein
MTRGWILTPERLAEYQAGTSAKALAEAHGTSEQTVRRRLLAIGVTPRTEKPSLMPIEEMRRRYESGIPATDLARETGLAVQSVQRRLRRAGVHIRGPAEKTALTLSRLNRMAEARRLPIPEDRLRELHAQGLSCRDMAPLLDCEAETVRRRLIELGLDRLPGKARPERNAFWRGGYAIDDQGYILKHQPAHPQATEGGYVRLHRLVMEEHLGRPLRPEEVVDHRNGDTSDNDPGNLRVYPSNAAHLKATLTGVRKLPAAERERLRQEAVLRARQRVAAILAA